MNIYRYVERTTEPKTIDTSLTARYAPAKTSEMLCTDMTILCTHQWFRDFRAQTPGTKRYLIVSGPSGVGKSTLVRLACSEHDMVPLDVSCSITKTRKELESNLQHVRSNNVLVVDEYDNVEACIASDIKDLSVKFPRLPIVLVCSKHTYGKPLEMCKHAEIIHMRRPQRQRLLNWAQAIAARESIHIDIEATVDRCKGDIRQVLMTLDLHRGGEQACLPEHIARKDPCVDAMNVIEMAMMCQEQVSVSRCMQLVNVDPSNVVTMAAENYLDIGCKDLERLAIAADAFSMADVMENTMYNTQNWNLYDSWLFSGSVYPMFRVRTPSTHALRFTKLWSKTSNMFLKMGHFRKLSARIPSASSKDYVYALSACMHVAMEKEDVFKMVERYGPVIPHELMPFILRLSTTRDLKQTQTNKIRQAYQKLGLQ